MRSPPQKQDHQPNPQQKTQFRANLGPQTETGANEDFAICACKRENMVFSAPTQTTLSKVAFFKIHQSKIAQFVSCASLTRQPNSHECTPPLNKNNQVLVFF